MLQYKNGRFYMGKASFALPDGFYVENDIELIEGSGFCAWDEEQKHLYRWRVFGDCEGTEAELQKWFLPDCGLIPLSEIVPAAVNGLRGHMVLYRSYSSQYCEARFDLGQGDELVLSVETRLGDVEKLPTSPAFRAVWEGLRGEKPEGDAG